MNTNSNNDLYNLNVANFPSLQSSDPASATTSVNDRFTFLSGSSSHMNLLGNMNINAMLTQNQQQPSHQYGTNNAPAAMLNNRSGMMMTTIAGAASAGGEGMSMSSHAINDDSLKDNTPNNGVFAAAPSAGLDFQTIRASFASSNTSVTADDDATSEAYRRCSKESLASHESLSDMLNCNASGTMDAAQQAKLLNLLQRQQLQMGTLSVANHPSNNGGVGVAAVAMMATLQQQGSGTASHRNSMTGSVAGAGGSFNLGGGGADMNPYMMNMNFMGGQHGLEATNLNNMTNNSINTAAPSNNNNNNMQGPTLLIPPKKSKNKHKETFAMKLMKILSLKECQASIRWMPNGRSFCIIDPKLLVEKVLPVYFKEAKYTSFTRKLNRWGFKHYSFPINTASEGSSSPDKEMSIYSHDQFRRDDPELCQTMDGGHRRRNARRDEERSRQFYSQLKPEVMDLLRQGGGEDGTCVGLGMGGNELAAQAQSIAQQAGSGSGAAAAAATSSSSAVLDFQLQQMQAIQFQLLQQQQQQQQLQPANQMLDMPSFMSNNAAAMSSLMGAGGANNGMASGAMGGNATVMNNSLLASANHQGLMGMMGGGGVDNNMNANAAMAAAAMTAAAQGGQLNNSLGMRRTSLGFMPYLPTTNVGRRDSMGSVFSAVGNNQMYDGKIESTFDEVGGEGAVTCPAGAAGGELKLGFEVVSSEGGNQTSKMEELQDMIASERTKQQSLVENNISNNDRAAV